MAENHPAVNSNDRYARNFEYSDLCANIELMQEETDL